LFHSLLYEATHKFFPVTPWGLRENASRAFTHTDAKTVCGNFAKGYGINGLTIQPIEGNLKTIAANFVDLHEWRHKADYDLLETFNRIGVMELVRKAEDAFSLWTTAKYLPNATAFLAALLLDSRWRKQNK